MERVQINIPEKILYQQHFKIVEADINDVNHMGNERVLVFVNSINYKNEGFLGDEIVCHVGVNNITECSFDLISHFIKSNSTTLAIVRTGIVYYDYEKRKIKALPQSFITAFTK